MNHKEAAPTADICLLLEGTWPYVRGGVSSWIHQMILGLPELTFSVMFIGGQRSAYPSRRYEVPSNVLHIEEVFLEDATHPANTRGTPREADPQQLLDLYRFLHHPDAPEPELGERLLDCIAPGCWGAFSSNAGTAPTCSASTGFTPRNARSTWPRPAGSPRVPARRSIAASTPARVTSAPCGYASSNALAS